MAPPLVQQIGVQLYYLFGWIPVFFVPWKFTWISATLCLLSIIVRIFWVTAFFHRYFAHKSFKTSRWFQFVMAFLAETSVQQGCLWWAATHRIHHRSCETEEDSHSPTVYGFWWSHCGWIADSKNYDEKILNKNIPDLMKYPELRMINAFYHIPCLLYALPFFYFGGAHAWFWGCWMSTWFLSHFTFMVNSVAHMWGQKKYQIKGHPECNARNNFWVALITCGEGWHNNHHAFMKSCKQGLESGEFDPTYWFIRSLAYLGLVWDLHEVSDKAIAEYPRCDTENQPMSLK